MGERQDAEGGGKEERSRPCAKCRSSSKCSAGTLTAIVDVKPIDDPVFKTFLRIL